MGELNGLKRFLVERQPEPFDLPRNSSEGSQADLEYPCMQPAGGSLNYLTRKKQVERINLEN
jgi:hypothetical protein